MNENKWIKLHSKILNWEWYKNRNTRDLFIHLILKANWKDGKFQGYDIPRGSLATGRKQLAEELNMTEQEIRTAINHLKSTNEITTKTTKKFSIITVVNYEKYQENNQVLNQQSTNNQPTTNQQSTTIVEYKNIEDIISSINNKYGRSIFPHEYERLENWIREFGCELVGLAFDISVSNNVKRFDYVQGILNNWKSAGYKTRQDVIENEQTKKCERKEVVDLFDYDWLNESEE